jgi:hypothetical protein
MRPKETRLTPSGSRAAEEVEPGAQADDDDDSLSRVEGAKGDRVILADPISLPRTRNRISRSRLAAGAQVTMVTSESLVEHNFYGVSCRLANCGLKLLLDWQLVRSIAERHE